MAFGLLQPDEDLDPAFRQEAAITNATRAAELQNQFLDRQREILHTGPEAFRSKTGRDAVLGADDVLARLESLRQETLDQAANEAQQQLLRGPLSQHRLLEHATVGDHVGRQTRAWRNATAASRLDLLRRQAELDYSDPDTIEALHTASDSASQELSRTMPRDAGDTFVESTSTKTILSNSEVIRQTRVTRQCCRGRSMMLSRHGGTNCNVKWSRRDELLRQTRRMARILGEPIHGYSSH